MAVKFVPKKLLLRRIKLWRFAFSLYLYTTPFLLSSKEPRRVVSLPSPVQ